MYLEFDLDRIFTDGLFSDFVIFYRLLHTTRLPLTNESATESWIEQYHQDSHRRKPDPSFLFTVVAAASAANR